MATAKPPAPAPTPAGPPKQTIVPAGKLPPDAPVALQPPAPPAPPSVILQPPPVTEPAPAVRQTPAGQAPIERGPQGEPEIRIYSHSNLLYWWPVWAVGFLMAFLSYSEGTVLTIGGFNEHFHPSNNLATCWFITLFLVILITNVPARGLASGMVILAAAFVTVVLAYFDWWKYVLRYFNDLSVHMNAGAYMFISTLLCVIWVLSVFIFDHLNYWLVKPGQLTHIKLFGAGQESYDTGNMMLEKYRNDIFRHWLLGLGSGDMKIQTMSANRQTFFIPNVLFVGSKIETVQRMISTRPNSFSNPT
jgi:hypothetical protein